MSEDKKKFDRKTYMKEYMKKYYPAWYQKNKDKHLKFCTEKIICECGKSYSRVHQKKHMNSKAHKDKIEMIRLIEIKKKWDMLVKITQ